MRLQRRLAVVGALGLLCVQACLAAGLKPGVEVLHDVAYGSDRLQRMDVYLPAPRRVDAPLIVMVHGGAWIIGDKSMRRVYQNKVNRWVPRGFIFVSVNNRMVPDADPLQQADDVAHALAEIQRRAPSWGGDPREIILMGHSAGAHLVALLGADPERARRAGAMPWLATIALDSGAMDVSVIMHSRHYRFYDKAFGADPEYWRRVSPTSAMTSRATPMLVVCSTRRENSCPQAAAFSQAAARQHVRAQVEPEDLSHEQINETLGAPGAYTDAVEKFMASCSAAFARMAE
jgi:arylformamidase